MTNKKKKTTYDIICEGAGDDITIRHLPEFVIVLSKQMNEKKEVKDEKFAELIAWVKSLTAGEDEDE